MADDKVLDMILNTVDTQMGRADLAETLAEMLFKTGGVVNALKEDPAPKVLETIKYARDHLKETEAAHALAEKRLPKHDWLDWYSAYVAHRSMGLGPKSSALTADMYVRWLLEKIDKAEKAATEKQMDSGMTGE